MKTCIIILVVVGVVLFGLDILINPNDLTVIQNLTR